MSDETGSRNLYFQWKEENNMKSQREVSQRRNASVFFYRCQNETERCNSLFIITISVRGWIFLDVFFFFALTESKHFKQWKHINNFRVVGYLDDWRLFLVLMRTALLAIPSTIDYKYRCHLCWLCVKHTGRMRIEKKKFFWSIFVLFILSI